MNEAGILRGKNGMKKVYHSMDNLVCRQKGYKRNSISMLKQSCLKRVCETPAESECLKRKSTFEFYKPSKKSRQKVFYQISKQS